MLKNSKAFKFLIGTFSVLALFAFVATTTYAAMDFGTATLKVGSKGEYVKTLQTLVGATADGSFGPMTKAKVMAWQSNNGLTADGLFGKMSMAKANAGSVVSNPTADLCPNGMTLASNCATAPGSTSGALCPNGMTLASNCAAAPGGVVSTGEGSITLTYDAIPSDNVVIRKGEANQAAVAFKVKATGSDMKVSRVWLDFDARLWLYADTASLNDGSTVLASVPLSSSVFSEVTVGSKWQLQFNNLSVTVPAGTTKVLTFSLGRPMLTQTSGTVTLQTSSTVRATDGAGFSLTYSPSATRALNLQSASATNGTLSANLSATSPNDQSVAGLSIIAGNLTAVKLMDFDLRALNSNATVTQLVATLAASTGTVANEVASVELRDGTSVLSSVNLATATATFPTLNILATKDTVKTLSIWAQMNPIGTPGAGYTSKGAGITATLTSASTVATDEAFNTVVVSSANVVGKTMYMFQYAPTLTLGAVTATPHDETIAASVHNGANYSIAFTVTAPAGSDIYLDSPTSLAAAAKTAAMGGTLVDSIVASGVTSKGTVFTTADKILAGTSRTFTVTGYVPAGGTAGFTGLKMVNLTWTDTDHATVPALITQTWGLSDYKTNEIYVSA